MWIKTEEGALFNTDYAQRICIHSGNEFTVFFTPENGADVVVVSCKSQAEAVAVKDAIAIHIEKKTEYLDVPDLQEMIQKGLMQL